MAFNAYLVFGTDAKNRKIGGESTSDVANGLPGAPKLPEGNISNPNDCQGAIEVTDFGFGVNMPVTTARSDGGGATVGRANFDVFTASKNIDTATIPLVEYCCKGTYVPRIVLHLFRAGSGMPTGVIKYAMVVFGNCVITKVGISGGGEELPKESLEFNYGQCEYVYQFTNHDSGVDVGGQMRTGWSLVANKMVSSDEKWEKEKVGAPGTASWK